MLHIYVVHPVDQKKIILCCFTFIAACIHIDIHCTHALYELAFICAHFIIIVLTSLMSALVRQADVSCKKERLCQGVCVHESLCLVLTAARGKSYGQNGLLSFRGSIISTFN